jgi:hypothetical protein
MEEGTEGTESKRHPKVFPAGKGQVRQGVKPAPQVLRAMKKESHFRFPGSFQAIAAFASTYLHAELKTPVHS